MRSRLATFRVREAVNSTSSVETTGSIQQRVSEATHLVSEALCAWYGALSRRGLWEVRETTGHPGRPAKGSGAYRPGPFVRYDARANRRALSPPRLLGCETQRPPGFHVEGSLLFSVLGGNSCPSSTPYNANASRMVSELRRFPLPSSHTPVQGMSALEGTPQQRPGIPAVGALRVIRGSRAHQASDGRR